MSEATGNENESLGASPQKDAKSEGVSDQHNPSSIGTVGCRRIVGSPGASDFTDYDIWCFAQEHDCSMLDARDEVGREYLEAVLRPHFKV
jgi:hypothetical protein